MARDGYRVAIVAYGPIWMICGLISYVTSNDVEVTQVEG